MIVEDTCVILKPFMFAQKTFEGEAYVTISMVPYVLYRIRSLLEDARNDPNTSIQVANLTQKMVNAFELHWRCREPGTVASEHLTEGPNRRPWGIPLITLLSSLLDPRFKVGLRLSQPDKDYLWSCILHQMVSLDRNQRADRRVAAEQEDAHQEHQIGYREQKIDRGDVFQNMFDDLNAVRMVEGQGNINNAVPTREQEGDTYGRAQAELTIYKAESMLPLLKEDRTYNNPLEWWKMKAQQFPLLSELAVHYLCIPATSATSERVFSSAGLTIAKEQSRTDPWAANELVFLHEAIPAVRRYRASIGAIRDLR